METEAIKDLDVISIMAEADTEVAETTEGAEETETESTETSTSDQSEETETEEAADGESESEDDASTEEATEETESEDGPALPEKQAKSYDKELTDHYAERFGWKPEDIENDKTKAYAVKKAIDSDIFIAQQQARLSALESEETEEKEETTEAAPVEQAKATPEQRAAYVENLSKFAKEVTDPEMATLYAKSWCKSQGVDYDKAVKGGFDPVGFTQEQTMFGANLVNTILPRLMPSFLSAAVEAVFPGFSQMYEGAMNANTWEQLRGSDANFKSLAAFGTPEYEKAVKDTIKANPWIDQMKFVDQKTGRELSRPKAVEARYRVVAQLLAGNVSPETIRQAVAKGKQEATGHTRKVTASRSLGAGKSKGTFQASKKDDFIEAIHEFNNSQKSSPAKE